MSKEKNTNKDNFLFKDNKSIKELFENIPEKFYQNFSLIVLLMMIFLVVEQTIVRFVTQDVSAEMYKRHFLYIGILAVTCALMFVIGTCFKFKKGEFKTFIKKNINDVLLFGLLVWTIITTLFGINIKMSYLGNYFRFNEIHFFPYKWFFFYSRICESIHKNITLNFHDWCI